MCRHENPQAHISGCLQSGGGRQETGAPSRTSELIPQDFASCAAHPAALWVPARPVSPTPAPSPLHCWNQHTIPLKVMCGLAQLKPDSPH